jgi:hypothetical protein
MSDSEILQSYNAAKDKVERISELSAANFTSKETICEILTDLGVVLDEPAPAAEQSPSEPLHHNHPFNPPRQRKKPEIPPRPWTPEDEAEILELRKQNYNDAEIAQRINRTERAVSQRFNIIKNGPHPSAVPKLPHIPKPEPPEAPPAPISAPVPEPPTADPPPKPPADPRKPTVNKDFEAAFAEALDKSEGDPFFGETSPPTAMSPAAQTSISAERLREINEFIRDALDLCTAVVNAFEAATENAPAGYIRLGVLLARLEQAARSGEQISQKEKNL